MVFNKIRATKFLLFLIMITACDSSESAQIKVEKAETSDKNTKPDEGKIKTIIFFGNSLSAGYGVEPEESFPALIQARLDSLGYPYRVVNAGVSGETSATGLNRVEWVIRNQNVDIFILELGANDGLRGLPPEQTKENLEGIIDLVRTLKPEAQMILAGMLVPPSMGEDYSKVFNPIFPQIAQTKDVSLIPFLLEDVGGVDSLNQADGIHPNLAGNRIVVENVWKVLQPLLAI